MNNHIDKQWDDEQWETELAKELEISLQNHHYYIQQLMTFLRAWKDTQLLENPEIHPLDIAAALEVVAIEIRKEQKSGNFFIS